jgi:acetyltransferase-like isoleucine patch superfamily enzyme
MKKLILLICTFLPSSLRLLIWRFLGMQVGRGCRVAMGSVVIADEIILDNGVIIEPLCLIYSPKVFRMGERARIASFVRIVGYHGTVEIQQQAFLGLGCLIDLSAGFKLGKRSQIGPRSTMYTHGTNGLVFSKNFPERIGPITIGSDCYIGMGCIIHPHVRIGNEVLIFPGLTIRTNISDNVAITPPETEYQIHPIRRLKVITDSNLQLAKIEQALQWLVFDFPGAILEKSISGYWAANLRGGRRIILVHNPDTPLDGVINAADKTIIWSLNKMDAATTVSQFCFRDLTIYGPETPFAETIAEWLATHLAQFVFSK